MLNSAWISLQVAWDKQVPQHCRFFLCRTKKQRTFKENHKKQFKKELHVIIADKVKKVLNKRSDKKKELHTLQKLRDCSLSESDKSTESDADSDQDKKVSFESDDERPNTPHPFDSSDRKSDSE